MLKYLGKPVVTFLEYPDEIALNFSISGCPNHCVGCSEPELAKDIGEELTFDNIELAIHQNPGITLIGLQGGDQDQDYLLNLVVKLKAAHPELKFGMYSGRNYLNLDLLNVLDYYKIGRWIMPEGPSNTWKDQVCGPLSFVNSNQVMFKRDGNKWNNITYKFRERGLNNLERHIVKHEK